MLITKNEINELRKVQHYLNLIEDVELDALTKFEYQLLSTVLVYLENGGSKEDILKKMEQIRSKVKGIEK